MDPKIKLALAFAALVTTSCDRASREGTPINSPSEDIFKTDQNKRGPIPIEQEFDAVHLVSHVAKCAEVKTSGFNLLQEKSELQSWDCSTEKTSQQWFYNAETREFLSSNGQCLGSGEAYMEGFEVHTAACDGTLSQSWDIDDGTSVIRNRVHPNHCLDIWNNNIHLDGRSIQLWPCNSNPNQSWTVAPLTAHQIESAYVPGTLLSADTSLGTVTLINPQESEESTQTQWILEPNGQNYRIRSVFSPRLFLHMQNGALELGSIEFYWDSAEWRLIPYSLDESDGYYIQNFWMNDHYLVSDSNNYGVFAAPNSDIDDLAHLWIIHSKSSD